MEIRGCSPTEMHRVTGRQKERMSGGGASDEEECRRRRRGSREEEDAEGEKAAGGARKLACCRRVVLGREKVGDRVERSERARDSSVAVKGRRREWAEASRRCANPGRPSWASGRWTGASFAEGFCFWPSSPMPTTVSACVSVSVRSVAFAGPGLEGVVSRANAPAPSSDDRSSSSTIPLFYSRNNAVQQEPRFTSHRPALLPRGVTPSVARTCATR